MDNLRKNYQQRNFSPSAAFFSGETFLKTNSIDSSVTVGLQAIEGIGVENVA